MSQIHRQSYDWDPPGLVKPARGLPSAPGPEIFRGVNWFLSLGDHVIGTCISARQEIDTTLVCADRQRAFVEMAENVRVICRVRPLSQVEKAQNSPVCITVPNEKCITLGDKTYNFDAVLDCASQQDAYETIGRPVIDSVINGINETIFVYGQTSSGKTYTIEGNLKSPELLGIIPRILDEIFLRISSLNQNLEFFMKVSYMELYMEKIKDLFDPSKDNLAVSEDSNKHTFVKGLTERYVSSYEDIVDALEEGKMNRHVSFTSMNAKSSRSHSIFTVTIIRKDIDKGNTLQGKLNLVDLAGSEKVSKSGAEGSTFDEAKVINKSLSTLGNVINALVEDSNHIPYRDSKLTRILQQSLGGNSKTTIVICVSPADFNEAESKSTLLFGIRAKNIRNLVMPNVSVGEDQWKVKYELEKETSTRLQEAVDQLETEAEKWRSGEIVPKTEWITTDKFDDPGVKKIPEVENTDLDADVNQELDRKDAEISKLTQEFNKHEALVNELNASIAKTRGDSKSAAQNETLLRKELEIKRIELQDLSNAIQDLATRLDQKSTALDGRNKEVEELAMELSRLREAATVTSLETQNAIRDLRETFMGSLNELTTSLYNTGIAFVPQLSSNAVKHTNKVDDQLAYLKFFIIQLSEAQKAQKKTASIVEVTKDKKLKTGKSDSVIKAKELVELKVVSEKALNHVKEERDKLTAQVDVLNRELLEAKQMTSLTKEISQAKETHAEVFNRVMAATEANARHYQDQIQELRKDVEFNSRDCEKCREENIHLKGHLENVMVDVAALKREKNSQDILATVKKVKLDAKKDIKPIEDGIIHDLQNLHNLRKVFVQDLRNRIRIVS